MTFLRGPLQVLEEKIRGVTQNDSMARSEMEQFHLSIGVLGSEPIIQLPRVVTQAGFPEGFFAWATGAQVPPALPSRTWALRGGGAPWNIHDSRVVSKRVLNRTRLQNYSYVPFSRGTASDAANFKGGVQGVRVKMYSLILLQAIFFLWTFYRVFIINITHVVTNVSCSIVFKFIDGMDIRIQFISRRREEIIGNILDYPEAGTVCS